MASVLRNQGKRDEAFRAYKKVYDKRKNILGPDHPDTLTALSDIADVLSNQGKHDEAFRAYKEVYDKRKNILGPNHLGTSSILSEIAQTLSCQGKYDKALQAYKKIHNKKKDNLGPDHPDTLTTLCFIARVLFYQKKHDDALQYYKEAYDKKADIGFYHLRGMADVLFAQGKYDEALNICNKVYDIQKRSEVLGPDHPDTLDTKQAIEMLRMCITLRSAINDCDTKAVIALLDKGADITQIITEKGKRVLHIATSRGNNEIIKSSLEYAKQLNPIELNNFINAKTTSKGKTALHLATKKGNLHIVKLLLENGAVYNAKDNCDNIPLQLSTSDKINYLLNLVESLFEAVKKGDNEQIGQCLEKEKAIVNARDNGGGGTPLYWAISKGYLDTANILLNNDADPTLVTNKGNTPLHMASNKGNTKAVKILLGHVKNNYPDKLGKFINAQTILGGTSALHIASNIEVTRSLLQYGAVYNIKNKEGKIPLDLAKNDDIRKLLSFTNELFEGVKNGNSQVISKLRSLKTDDFIAVTNVRNDQGHTLLQVAIASKHRDIATELSKMLKNLAPSSSMESVNVAGPSRSYGNLPL